MPYYVIVDTQNKNGDKPQLVFAKTKAAALAKVVDPRYTVTIAEQKDLILLSAAGVKVIGGEE